MPSVNIKLPKYVVARPKKDGTFRVLFEVPKRLRPSGWLPTIPTPPHPHRTGRLDAAELSAIETHVEGAGGLLEQLEACRAGGGAPVMHAAGSLPALAALWEASWDDSGIRPRTQAFYRSQLAPALAWSATNKDPQVSAMTRKEIKTFLETYNDRQTRRAAIKRTLSALFEFARDEGELTANPIEGMKMRRTQKKRAVELWDRTTVAQYADAAKAMGWTGGAILVNLLWETSADASDIVTWRKDTHFVDGPVAMIVYDRGKTGVQAEVAISEKAAALIRGNGALYFVTDRRGRIYEADSVKDDNRRSTDFGKMRDLAMKAGAPRRLMDHLRHSAATDAVACGADIENVPSLTAHKGTGMLTDVYLQKTRDQMLAIQRQRGIIW